MQKHLQISKIVTGSFVNIFFLFLRVLTIITLFNHIVIPVKNSRYSHINSFS